MDYLTIERRKHGKGFKYLDAGELVRCTKQKAYFKSLAIPPVYTNVKIAGNPRRYLIAMGDDSNGNAQYFYHPSWENYREEYKFKRLPIIGERLPAIRSTVSRHLKLSADDPRKVLATLVRLLDCTGLRIGNWHTAKTNHTYGLLTLHKQHLQVTPTGDELHFKGKAGVEIDRPVYERAAAKLLENYYYQVDDQEDPLFTFHDRPITAAAVNEYLADISNIHMTAKEFRTWRSNALFIKYWSQAGEDPTIKSLLENVAQHTCNTTSILQSSYIAPVIIEQVKDRAVTAEARGRAKAAKSGRASIASCFRRHVMLPIALTGYSPEHVQ